MTGGFSIHGILPALVTPFTAQGEVDQEAQREIVRFLLKHGVHGLFVGGTTGMGPVMMPEERKIVAEIAVKEARGRAPVIIQIGAVNPTTSFELAAHAEMVGADAIASLTPFYYRPGDEAIIAYYEKLSQVTGLPLFIYNIPENTTNNVDAALLSKLAKIRNIVGIKDSSRNFIQLVDYLQVVPKGFNIVNGTESYLFSAFCAGINAGISAMSNVFPELFLNMYEAHLRKDLEKGAELQLKVDAIRDALSKPPIAPILEGLRLRGVKSGSVRLPLRSMTTSEIENLRISIAQILPQIELQHNM
jgi:4-hydroxy-tetrahydrodipicolinate synthase